MIMMIVMTMMITMRIMVMMIMMMMMMNGNDRTIHHNAPLSHPHNPPPDSLEPSG
jgi:flagellar basal body-associated protein FliL